MFCGNKPEPFIKLVAFLLNVASGFSEKIGGVFFSDEIKYIFPLTHTSSQINLMFENLLGLLDNLGVENQKKLTCEAVTNFSSALDFAKRSFLKKGFIFIISDFINVSNWEKLAFEASQKQNICLFQIFDPLDFALPKKGYISLIDPETKKRFTVNTDSKMLQENYHNLMLDKQKKLKAFLSNIGAYHLIIEKRDFL